MAHLAAALLALALALAASARAAEHQLPENWIRCPKDKSWPKCVETALPIALKDLAQGLPKFGTPPLDPLHIPQLVIGQHNRDNPVNININFTNIVIFGLKTANPVADSVWADLDKYKFGTKGQAPYFHVDADYVMDGRILLLPATGKGRVNFNITDLEADLVVEGTENIKKGVTYMKVTDFKINLKISKMSVEFDNLFNGDKTLGNAINSLLNENWKDLWEEIREPLEQTLRLTFNEFARRIFDKVAWKDVFSP